MGNINIEPLNDRVLVKPDPKREMTDSGIIIPDSAKEHYVDLKWGVVVRVSKKVPEIKEGLRVQFPATAGQEQDINGTKYRSIRDCDIWHAEVPVDENDKL